MIAPVSSFEAVCNTLAAAKGQLGEILSACEFMDDAVRDCDCVKCSYVYTCVCVSKPMSDASWAHL